MTTVRDVVLIHSTGQGAAGWERVVRALGERGQTAHAVELPSDPELLAADYAERIRRQVGAIAAPVVLAHSGAGPLLPAAARALTARHQVWLAAGPGGELRRGHRPQPAGRLQPRLDREGPDHRRRRRGGVPVPRL
jgi:hypothetical protein